MTMDLDGLKDKALNFAKDHSEQVEQGVEKAADFAEKKFGHEEQIDKVVDKVKDVIPGGEHP
jgi:hypothetical protein